jgi:branched-chain amino acid transport system permease protein
MDVSTVVISLINGLLMGSMYVLMGVGFTIIFGVMGLCNFAQGEFYMLGAYIVYFLAEKLELNPIVAFPLAALVTFTLGATVEKICVQPIMKLRHAWQESVMILTIGLSVLFQNLALVIFGSQHRGLTFIKGTISFLGTNISLERLVILLCCIFIIALFWFLLHKTTIGKAIRAVGQDKDVASLMGINSNKIFLVTFALSTMLSGIAGGLLLPILLAYPTVGSTPMLRAFIVTIFGGLGSVRGAMLAGFIIGLTEAFITMFFPSTYVDFFVLGIMITVILLKPQGLLGD